MTSRHAACHEIQMVSRELAELARELPVGALSHHVDVLASVDLHGAARGAKPVSRAERVSKRAELARKRLRGALRRRGKSKGGT